MTKDRDEQGDGGPATRRPNGLTYADAGVSIDAGAALVDKIAPMAARTHRTGVLGGLGGFGGLFDPRAAGHEGSLLVAATDGVGTKLKLAIEADDLSGVGVDLVAMCVNDLLCQGAEPLFFLDYFATGKLDPEKGARIVEGVAKGCETAGCALLGGETAEMPGLYHGEDFDLAGFAVGAVARDGVLPRSTQAGDAIIGLPSSGPHSNGYSLIRRVVAELGLWWDAAAPFDPDQPLGQALLTPTTIYVADGLAAIADGHVEAIAHITGGGLTENLPRALGPGLTADVDMSTWSPPAVFSWLARAGGVAELEMLRTFNCGVGLAFFCRADAAEALTATLTRRGLAPIALGRVAAHPDGDDAAPSVRYSGALF